MGSAKNLAIVVGATMAWTGFLKTIGINLLVNTLAGS